MLRKLRKAIKGQSTAEYALLIALVVAAVIAMQTFAKRAIQARIFDASKFMVNETSELGSTVQYEPYYLSSEYAVTRDQEQTTRMDSEEDGIRLFSGANIVRGIGGSETQAYNATGTLEGGMQ